MFYLAMAKTFIKTSWKSQIEYPLPFIMGIITQFFNFAMRYVVMYFMVSTFGTIKGWSAMEILLLYAVAQCCYGLGACLSFNPARYIPELARNGGLNDYMVRPVNSLFYIIFSNFNVGYITHLTISIMVIIISIIFLEISLSFLGLLWLILSLISGGIICACIMLILTTPSIIFIGNNSLTDIFFSFRDLINYPLSIFDTPLQLILTFILPFGFMNFYPIQPLINKNDMGVLPQFVQYLSPLVAIIMVLLLAVVWRFTINRYESTGA